MLLEREVGPILAHLADIAMLYSFQLFRQQGKNIVAWIAGMWLFYFYFICIENI